MPERIYLLLLRKLLREASANDLHELEVLLDKHPELLPAFQELQVFWQQEGNPTASPDLLNRHLERLKVIDSSFGLQEENVQVPFSEKPFFTKGNMKKLLAIAATLTILLLSTYWVFTQSPFGKQKNLLNQQKAIVNEVRTHAASRTKVVLPDGTQVWVNSASQLLYNPDFGRTHRKVTLNGEAYFIVSKNKDLPFEIETRRIAIKVTGTTFNVRAYDNEEKAETSLFEGSVQVKQNKIPDKTYYMKPNQKLIINESEQGLNQPPGLSQAKSREKLQNQVFDNIKLTDIKYDPIDSLALETSWVFSTLAFSNESFEELARKMEKWYGVEFMFQSKKLENIHFTGRFTTETVTEALEALQFTAKFKYKREGDRITIYL